jgi:hypothetical protein
MESVFAHLLEALPAPATDPTYAQQVAEATAAFAALIAMLVVIYLVIRVTYLILKVFTSFALTLTLAIVVIFTVIGLLNR